MLIGTREVYHLNFEHEGGGDNMEQVGTVAQLWRYPVKSMAGETVASADLGPLGMRTDAAGRFATSRRRKSGVRAICM
jgi:MOSC N-terminal beta barrel domain